MKRQNLLKSQTERLEPRTLLSASTGLESTEAPQESPEPSTTAPAEATTPPTQEQPTQDQPAQDQPAQDQPAQDQPAQDQPAQPESQSVSPTSESDWLSAAQSAESTNAEPTGASEDYPESVHQSSDSAESTLRSAPQSESASTTADQTAANMNAVAPPTDSPTVESVSDVTTSANLAPSSTALEQQPLPSVTESMEGAPAEQKTTEQKTTEQKTTEQKTTEQKTAEQPTSEPTNVLQQDSVAADQLDTTDGTGSTDQSPTSLPFDPREVALAKIRSATGQKTLEVAPEPETFDGSSPGTAAQDSASVAENLVAEANVPNYDPAEAAKAKARSASGLDAPQTEPNAPKNPSAVAREEARSTSGTPAPEPQAQTVAPDNTRGRGTASPALLPNTATTETSKQLTMLAEPTADANRPDANSAQEPLFTASPAERVTSSEVASQSSVSATQPVTTQPVTTQPVTTQPAVRPDQEQLSSVQSVPMTDDSSQQTDEFALEVSAQAPGAEEVVPINPAAANADEPLANVANEGTLVTVRASGDEGSEQFELFFGEQSVGTYEVTTESSDYSYQSDRTITADEIRVAFFGDIYDPANGIDTNLNVPWIQLDSQTYLTDSPEVFSTGAWNDADGIVAGFGRGSTLHTDGYFQYANAPNGGSLITVQASGDEGGEQFHLRIDDQIVDTFSVSTELQDYVYQAQGAVEANQVQVEFFGDVYQPDLGVDTNLNVPTISIDDQQFLTASDQVFSTGTWLEADSITPGFGRGSTLHGNGYFQYGVSPPASGSTISVLASGDEGSEKFHLLVGEEIVETYSVSTSLSEYTYQANSQVTPDDIRIEFFDDLYQPEIGFDTNLNVPEISIDGTTYQTDSSEVFSTGTYREEDGFAPGFGRGDTLHGNGYFQYASAPTELGFLSLSQNLYTVNESDGFAEVTINRTGSTAETATVQFRALQGSASEDEDFAATSGVLTFEPGSTSEVVSIPLLDDDLSEGNETFSFVIDAPTGASLLVPRTATVEIIDDETNPNLPNFSDFGSTAGLKLNGSAQQVGNAIELTGDNQQIETGSVFFGSPIEINSNSSFQTEFTFEVTGGTNGADGFAFLLQNDPLADSALGGPGGGLGFAEVSNSVAIKFDTYQNVGESSDNIIGLSINGNFVAEASADLLSKDLNDGEQGRAFIDYNGLSNQLAVYVSNNQEKPATPSFTTTVDLAEVVGEQAYIGFTAATGGFSNAHRILDWQFSDEPPIIVNPPSNLTREFVQGGLFLPTSLDFSPDGSNLYIAEQGGKVTVLRNGVDAGVVVDFEDQVNGVRDRGLIDIAIHPDLENNPYLYTSYTYDPPEVYENVGDPLAGPDGTGNRAARVSRWTLDFSTDYTRVIPDSEVVLVGKNSTWENFNAFANSTDDFAEPPAGILPDGSNLRDFIATDSESHTVGAIEFAPDGALIISTGDGTSYNRADPRTVRVLDIDNLSGKILRVDAITGEGLADNPFYNGDSGANQSKVYQYGLRNPFRIAVNDAGQVFVGDVGWTQWEEINTAEAGANFGWPFFEGDSQGNARTGQYEDLPGAEEFYANEGLSAVAPIAAFNHAREGVTAIVVGDFYSGEIFPEEYGGDLFFTDLGQGIVKNASFDQDGNLLSIETFDAEPAIIVQIVTGPDGKLYYADIGKGEIGRWTFV